MSSECLFCKILNGEVPSTKVFENEDVYAFRDLSPQAKEHLLFISKTHDKNVNEMIDRNTENLLKVFTAIREYTEASDLTSQGFRVVTNYGPNAGQTVFHTHFHVVGGEPLGYFGK